jgi:hypothetical protein
MLIDPGSSFLWCRISSLPQAVTMTNDVLRDGQWSYVMRNNDDVRLGRQQNDRQKVWHLTQMQDDAGAGANRPAIVK